MMPPAGEQLNVAIACGGTGGHLFPGLAVADRLVNRGCRITLMVSAKEIDQLAVKAARQMRVVTLPAIGLTAGHRLEFIRGFLRSYRMAAQEFRRDTPQATLAMGGFTSAPPVLAAKQRGAATFLHESNSIPGRANRWLSWLVDRAFLGFPSAADALHTKNFNVTGTPVRPVFQELDAAACRAALGLEPSRPVALVMGGSQGAHGINELVIKALPSLAREAPDWQWIHLTGSTDFEKAKQAYASLGIKAVIRPFFAEMDRAMGAATAAISRAGASSLAEIAAVRLPAVLIPFPAATDNHQFHNARAFEQSGAARLLDQKRAEPHDVQKLLLELMREETVRAPMQAALAEWHRPQAADQIAEAILQLARLRVRPGCAPHAVHDRGSNGVRLHRSSVSAVVSGHAAETHEGGAA